jgi:ribosomal-protein-alanine N-acetyltransferase
MKKLFTEIPNIEGKGIVLRGITQDDAVSLRELTESENVYRFLPTFLFEKQYDSIEYVIDHLYDECFRDSIILGIYSNDEFCGIAEMYGYRDEIHKISVGYRLLERFWGQGIASKALGLMIDYLYNETDIEIITASTMIENKASARVLQKNGFELVVHAVPEDWGFEEPTTADKWIR